MFIRDMITAVCQFLKLLFDYVIKPSLCIIKTIIRGFVEFFKMIIDGINSICPGGCGLGSLSGDTDKAIKTIDGVFDCNMQSPFNCTKIFPDNGNAPSHLPMPTRCWMGYKPQIGEQHGLGCSASDTCMDDDGTLIACAACTGGIDMQRFGCDSLTKLCRCHTFPVGKTECSTHLECQLPDTECGFVDAYLQPSFGNIPCSRCSSQSICLVTASIGQCTCLLRQTPTQSCPAEYRAQRVTPDPTQICLVSLGIGVSTNGEYSANWVDLAATPCALLNGARTFCITVYLQNGGFANMAVGLALLGRRRLLSIDTYRPNLTAWEEAHEPCRSLMQAQNLTLLEQHYASECERWRQIGERTIMIYNLSARPVQFTSYLGMAESNITLQAYLYMFRYADWAQPIFVLGRRYTHYLIPILNTTRLLFNRLQQIPEAQSTIAQVQALMPWFTAIGRPLPSSEPVNFTNNTTASTGRRLLNWKDNIDAVQQYSIQIAQGNLANLAPDLAAEWSKGPFLWPPNYNYWQRDHPCLLGELTWNFTYLTMLSTAAFYTKSGPRRPPVARTLTEALPDLSGVAEKATKFEPELVGFVKRTFKSLLGFDISFIKRYISSPDGGATPSQLSQDVTDLIRCDFEKVQHCTGHRRSLVWGAVIVGGFLIIVSVVLRTLGVPMADPLLIMAYVPLTLMFVFSYPLVCIPLVPTCMLSEILMSLEEILPSSVTWPTQLQRWPGCIDGSVALNANGAVDYSLMQDVRPGTAQCFRECSEWPFAFKTWEDNAQWIACEAGWCDAEFIKNQYQPWVETLPLPQYIYDLVHMDRYVSAAAIKPMYMQWQDMKQSQRICCAFTVFNVIPVLLMSVVLVVALLAVASIVTALAQASISTAVALLTYIHTR
jgi:hypothetical protein